MDTIFGVSWVWWLLGTLGIAGTVALAVLAPAVLSVVVQAVVRFVGYLLSTRWGCALLAAAVAFVVADINRSMRDAADFKAKTEAFEQAQRDRDERIARETREDVMKEVAAATAESAEIDKGVKEFKDALPPVPHTDVNVFRVGSDACRLRLIAGQAGCGPEKGTLRVPTPRGRPKADGDHR